MEYLKVMGIGGGDDNFRTSFHPVEEWNRIWIAIYGYVNYRLSSTISFGCDSRGA